MRESHTELFELPLDLICVGSWCNLQVRIEVPCYFCLHHAVERALSYKDDWQAAVSQHAIRTSSRHEILLE